MKVRVVIYVNSIGFSKTIDVSGKFVVGQSACIEFYPGCICNVDYFNFIAANEMDQIDTHFFFSRDYKLFEKLCDCLTMERGWVEVEQTEPVLT